MTLTTKGLYDENDPLPVGNIEHLKDAEVDRRLSAMKRIRQMDVFLMLGIQIVLAELSGLLMLAFWVWMEFTPSFLSLTVSAEMSGMLCIFVLVLYVVWIKQETEEQHREDLAQVTTEAALRVAVNTRKAYEKQIKVIVGQVTMLTALTWGFSYFIGAIPPLAVGLVSGDVLASTTPTWFAAICAIFAMAAVTLAMAFWMRAKLLKLRTLTQQPPPTVYIV